MEVRITHVNITVVGQATDEDRLELEVAGATTGDVLAALKGLEGVLADRLKDSYVETGLDGPPDPYTGSRLPNDPGPGPEDGGLSMARNPEVLRRLDRVFHVEGRPSVRVIPPFDGPRVSVSLEPSELPEVDFDLVCTWGENPVEWAGAKLWPGEKVTIGNSTPRAWILSDNWPTKIVVIQGPAGERIAYRAVPERLVEWAPPDLPVATEGEGDGGPARGSGLFDLVRKFDPGKE